MSPEFEEANREALDEAAFDLIVNFREHQPEALIAEGLDKLGSGISWAGFWVAVGIVIAVGVWKRSGDAVSLRCLFNFHDLESAHEVDGAWFAFCRRCKTWYALKGPPK